MKAPTMRETDIQRLIKHTKRSGRLNINMNQARRMWMESHDLQPVPGNYPGDMMAAEVLEKMGWDWIVRWFLRDEGRTEMTDDHWTDEKDVDWIRERHAAGLESYEPTTDPKPERPENMITTHRK